MLSDRQTSIALAEYRQWHTDRKKSKSIGLRPSDWDFCRSSIADRTGGAPPVEVRSDGFNISRSEAENAVVGQTGHLEVKDSMGFLVGRRCGGAR